MKITKEEIEHLASLAKISLTEKEKEKFQKQLSSILDYVAKLKEVDTKNVEPTFQVTGLSDVVRKDEAKRTTNEIKENILKNAPRRTKDFIETKGVFG